MNFSRQLYLRLLGATVVIAAGSYWSQLDGLAGSQGIAPAKDTLDAWSRTGAGFVDLPTALWLSSSDGMLRALCALTVLGGILLAAGIKGAPGWVALCWACWVSLVSVGAPFLSFQWDVLLCEALFFSFFYAATPDPAAWARFLLAWLSFKLTFASGIVKWVSGDPSWRDFTALSFHYWTQPLPTWTSYLANQWPMAVHKLFCAVMFVLELIIPVFALGPRMTRRIAAVGLLSLQVGLALAGNYSYFNLLSAVLCVPLLDDTASRRQGNLPGWAFAAAVAVLGTYSFLGRLGVETPAPIVWPLSQFQKLHSLNAYGAFAVMTKTRPEIIVEGSADGQTWTPYEFRWKPGRVDARPKWVAPLQPRLDWQMWFAALGTCGQAPWLLEFQRKLLVGSAPVLALLESGPAHPKFIRSRLFQYRFAPPDDPGVWWTREEQGPFCPVLTLAADGVTLTRAP